MKEANNKIEQTEISETLQPPSPASRRNLNKSTPPGMVEVSVRRSSPMPIRRRRSNHKFKYVTKIALPGLLLFALCTGIAVIFLHYGPTSSDRPYRKAQKIDAYAHPIHDKQITTRTDQHQHGHYLRTPKTPSDDTNTDHHYFDAIVVGSGLAGLSTTLELLDRGGKVALVEKEATLGGNSLKASSGMNACCEKEDTEPEFIQDTTKSAGDLARPPMIHELVSSSASALQWLQTRVGVDLSQIAQLGGHSHARTHRPSEGMVGAELIVHLEMLVQTYQTKTTDNVSVEGQVTIFTDSPVTQILQHGDQIRGVQILHGGNNSTILQAPQVVLATGGFASDRRPNSLLSKVRPDLLHFGTTGGSFSTGDGISLATQLGANTVDMEEIQLHPTGFVDPNNPADGIKVLAAELLRGVGGILLNRYGERFCNELGTRDYVTKQMLAQPKDENDNMPTFTLLLTKEAAENAQKHVDLYKSKSVLTEMQGVDALVQWLRNSASVDVSMESLHNTFARYQSFMSADLDDFGKTSFRGFPTEAMNLDQWEQQTFFVGTVTPVLHYCMGGVAIDTEGQVLNAEGNPIIGLYAAGEVTGGVHGKNRLGGNSLLECAVFGRKIGQSLTLRSGIDVAPPIAPKHQPHNSSDETSSLPAKVFLSAEELKKHSQPDDLWMALHGWVYNLTNFANQHPGGAAILQSLAGTDGTKAFATVHSESLLQPFQKRGQSLVVGKYVPPDESNENNISRRVITDAELKQHATAEDCWVALHGIVYDLTQFSITHPGGAYLIQKHAGKDATDVYKVFHRKEKLALVENRQVGIYEDSDEHLSMR